MTITKRQSRVFTLVVGLVVLVPLVCGLEHAATTLIYVAALPANAFVVLYAAAFPWWRSWEGRFLLVLYAGLAMILNAAGLFWWLGDDYTGRHAVRYVTYLLLAVGSYGLLYSLVSEARHRSREVRQERVIR